MGMLFCRRMSTVMAVWLSVPRFGRVTMTTG